MTPLIDTNVIVRFLTADKNKEYETLYTFFASLENGGAHVELKLIVLFQAFFVLNRFYKVPKDDLCEGLLTLMDYRGIKIREKEIVRRMLILFRENKLDIVDCYLAACLEKDSGAVLYSYDRDFDKMGINRIAP